MSVLRALLEARSIENPERPLTDASLIDILGGHPTDAGVSVTPESAYRFTAVYRCIAILSGLIAALPLFSYRRTDSGRLQVPSFMDDPHPDMTPFEVKEFVAQGMLSWGNGYAFKVRDGLGRVQELEPLHPRLLHVERKKAWRSDANPSGKRLELHEGGTVTTYTPRDILHIPAMSYDGVVGMSPIQLAAQGIGLTLAAESFGAKMFGRGALIQGVLQTDQHFKDDKPAKRLKGQWRRLVSGPDRHWDIPVLDSGTKFVPIGLPPEAVQFIQTRQFGVVEMARQYGIPPHLVGAVERSTSWGTGIEQQNMQMLTFTADPWLVRFEQRCSKELVLGRSRYYRFKRAALLRADTATRYLAYQRGINNGWLSADEIRALEEMEPLPNGQGEAFYRPGNVVPLSEDVDDTEEEGGAA